MTDHPHETVHLGSRGVALAGAGLCLVLTIVVLLDGDQIAAALSLRTVCAVASAMALAACGVLLLASPRGMFSLGGLYALTFLVFHFGLALVFALGYDPAVASNAPSSFAWFYDPATNYALMMAATGATGLGAGVCVQSLIGRGPIVAERDGGEFPFEVGGFLVLVASMLSWLYLAVVSGGFAVLVGSYGGFLEATRGVGLPLTYFGIGLGLAVMAVGRPSHWRRAAGILFAAWALVAFPLGLRGEVLFPLAGALAVASLRRPPFGHGRLLLVGVGLLAAIALVRVLRQVGIAGEHTGIGIKANPLEAFIELGSSLRPVTEVVRWASDGEPALWGASFWAPFERIFHYLFPLWHRPPAVEDPRLMNVLILQRVGPIGFSPVAEAFHNFRAGGPFLVMFLVGNLLGWLDRRPLSRSHQALAAVIIVPLLIQVRNAFSHVPGQILIGVFMLGGMMAVRCAWRLIVRHRGEAST